MSGHVRPGERRLVRYAARISAFIVLIGCIGYALPETSAAAAETFSCSATGAGSPTYTVDVGAPVSNGGDSSTEIENAIKTASSHSGGGQVVLEAGTYTITHTIDVGANVELTGAGESSTTLIAGSTANVDPMITTDGSSNVTVENMTVNQDGVSRSGRVQADCHW